LIRSRIIPDVKSKAEIVKLATPAINVGNCSTNPVSKNFNATSVVTISPTRSQGSAKREKANCGLLCLNNEKFILRILNPSR
jgi:hypothetical protein